MKRNAWLLVIVLLLVIIPLGLKSTSEFAGTDGQALEIIEKVSPTYEPWFSNIWEPNSGEIESLLFALQAALGAGFIGYVFGFAKARLKFSSKESERRP
ncbi:energy-coupling factor ABC transporter substrate-binding protein [Pseudalkalibacillus decolorationis]|uniref:energy-coupling factor ABC transporter substrate-binding protein n=1 Tax=Pseudalkalibacillus decolorationis TaxID=163879 RepID=UPI00214944B6|nr:energy-coupling factor ABC transporter substrate-binding protein [Pseudalkalibacillus decolorationis]